MAIYDDVIAQGIEHTNHESDLYLPVTAETTALVNKYYRADGRLSGSVSFFTDKITGKLSYDIAFAYLPYWRRKEAKR